MTTPYDDRISIHVRAARPDENGENVEPTYHPGTAVPIAGVMHPHFIFSDF